MGSKELCKFCILYPQWKERKGFMVYDDEVGFGIPANTPITYGHFIFIAKHKIIPANELEGKATIIHTARMDQLEDPENYVAGVRRAFLEVQEICRSDQKRISSFYEVLKEYNQVNSDDLFSAGDIAKIAEQMLQHPHRGKVPQGYMELTINYLIPSPEAHLFTHVIPLYEGDLMAEIADLIEIQLANNESSGNQTPYIEMVVNEDISYLMQKKDHRRVMGALREHLSLEKRVRPITQELTTPTEEDLSTAKKPKSPDQETPDQE